MGAEQWRVELARRLFGVLKANHIAFCAVGDTGEFPHRIPSDLDVVVDYIDAPKLPQLLYDVALQTGTKLVQVIRHEPEDSPTFKVNY
jgi:hypothetical protein